MSFKAITNVFVIDVGTNFYGQPSFDRDRGQHEGVIDVGPIHSLNRIVEANQGQ
jgi:hypothetical protein